jgi:hypothetical protein
MVDAIVTTVDSGEGASGETSQALKDLDPKDETKGLT